MHDNRSLRVARIAWILAAIILVPATAAAGGFREEVERGNRALLAGEYDEALASYEKAGVAKPESPHLYFNKALAAYRKEDYAAAREGFEQAALRTKDLGIEALAQYNLGNVSVREAERLIDGELETAIDTYGAAVKHYQRALELDPGIDDAAVNIEVVRVIIKDLLDKLANQQEEGGGEIEEIVRRLAELVEAEGLLVEKSEELSESDEESSPDALANALADALAEALESQRSIREESQSIAEDMKQLEAGMAPPAGGQGQTPGGESPLSTSTGHVEESVTDQMIAEAYLEQSNSEESVPYQKSALSLLQKALDELTDDQQQQQQQQQQSGEQPQESQEQPSDEPSDEEQEQDASAEKAEDILREEEENQRQRAVSERYISVEKDW